MVKTKRYNATELYTLLYGVFIMSWTDTCGNCGEHRADCECLHWASVKTHTCEYCKNKCKKKTADGKEYECCKNFVLATR